MAGGRDYKGYTIRDGRPGNAAGQALQDNFKLSADHRATVAGNPHVVTAAEVGSATAQWNAAQLQSLDISDTAPSNGEVLAWIAATSKWTPSAGGGGGGDHSLLGNLSFATAGHTGFEASGAAAAAIVTHLATYNHANYDTAYGWGDHAGLYDPAGTMTTHESTYNHANYDTAYGWGDHAGLYDPAGTMTTHESTYNHANYDTAYGWGNHAGLYAAVGHTIVSHDTAATGAQLTTLTDGVSNADALHVHAWSVLTATPTTLAGYSISDTKANFNTALSDGSFSFVGDAPTAHIHTGHEVEIAEVGTATYDDVQDFINNTMSSGYISGGAVTDNGDGSVASAAGKGYIRADSTDISELKAFDFGLDASIALTDDALNYVYVNYNGGTPVITATDDVTTLDHTSEFVLALAYRDGTDVHITQTGQKLNNFIHRLLFQLWEVDGIVRSSGIVTSETGTRNLDITAGVLYWALERIVTPAIDTTPVGDTFTYQYRDGGGGWTSVAAQAVIDNTQYDDGDGGLGTLTTNRYGVHWVYMVPDGDVYVLYGQGDYVLAQAEAATPPASIPAELAAIGVLIAKIIVKKSAAAFTEVLIPWTSTFGASTATDHGGLAGLADDDHTGYHTDGRAATWLANNHETTYNHANYDTAYGWGDHAGLYDPAGTMTTHESTYNHANYDTAYGWGDHAGLYDPAGTMTTHESTYNHANYNTAYGWGDHAGLYDPAGTMTTHESTYNHANYNTAYGWGDHSGLYSLSAHAHEGTAILSTGELGASTFLRADGLGGCSWVAFDATGTGLLVLAISPVLTTPQINDTSSDHQYVFAVSELADDRTVTLPLLLGNDTFVFNAFGATLTNKTLALGDNTVSGTKAQFDTACTDGDFAFAGGAFHDGFSDYDGNDHIDHTTVSITVAGTANEISSSAGAQTIAASRTWTIGIADNPIIPGTGGIEIPQGTTAQRIANDGVLRINTDTSTTEIYRGAAWQDLEAGGGGGGTVQGTDATYDIQATLDGATDGDPRGENSVDLSTIRSAAAMVAAGATSAIGGGEDNLIDATAPHGVIGGGAGNTINADTGDVTTCSYGTIGGGIGHRIGDDAQAGSFACNTIGGGYYNTASGSTYGYVTIGGGSLHTASGDYTTIGGGYYNTADSVYATVGGGTTNSASGVYATIGGGCTNSTASAANYGDTIGGGSNNTVSSYYSGGNTIGGGYANSVSTYSGDYNTIGGGSVNIIAGSASASWCTIGGGSYNAVDGSYATVDGGYGNNANGYASTIGGGYFNTASGDYATVLGGYYNSATGDSSTCSGKFASDSGYDGCFVFCDSNTASASGPVTADTAYFEVAGGLQLVTGSEGAGKHLLSDANGVGDWAVPDKVVTVRCVDPGTVLTTGDGKGYFTIPAEFNGMNLTGVAMAIYTASSSGLPEVQLHNLDYGGGASDMLSVTCTIDTTELNSYTATTAATINGAKDDVATGDRIRIDCDTAGTGTTGLDVILTFSMP